MSTKNTNSDRIIVQIGCFKNKDWVNIKEKQYNPSTVVAANDI